MTARPSKAIPYAIPVSTPSSDDENKSNDDENKSNDDEKRLTEANPNKYADAEMITCKLTGNSYVRMYFKDQFELKSTAGLVSRNLHFKSIEDVRKAILVRKRHPTTKQFTVVQENFFESDQEFMAQIMIIPLSGCDKVMRGIFRLVSLNNGIPLAFSQLMKNYSNPATIAILTTILHVKDEVTVQSTEPSDWGKFFKNLGLSIGFVLGLITFMKLLFDLVYVAYRTLYRHIEVLRITRFQFLQDQYDEINIYGNDWTWVFNYKEMDPDLAMIYYHFKDEKNDANKNILGCGARKQLEKAHTKLKQSLNTVTLALKRPKRGPNNSL